MDHAGRDGASEAKEGAAPGWGENPDAAPALSWPCRRMVNPRPVLRFWGYRLSTSCVECG